MFYGWYIVVASMLLTVFNGGIVVYGFTAFVNPIAATFGWSYAQIALAMSLRGVETGALNPLFGMAVDRWPPNRLVLIGVIVFALGLFCLSQVTNMVMFYVSFLIIALGSSLAAFMVPTTMVARWFRRDVGKASGVLAMGVGIGGVLLPLLVKMIDTYGWQNVLIVLAVGICVLGIPISFVFRSRPEDYGLTPDGKPQDDLKGSSSLRVYDFSTGVKEALKMRAFWYIGIALMFQMAAMAALTVHIMPYLVSIGMERSLAGMVAMLVPLASLATRIPSGFLTDIFKKKYILALSCGLIGVGSFLFWLTDGSSFGLTLLAAITLGCGAGGAIPSRVPILREYFGTKNFGVIFGLISIFITIGLISSPPLAGWVFDTLGVYDPIWLILGGVAMLGAIVILNLPSPSRVGAEN